MTLPAAYSRREFLRRAGLGAGFLGAGLALPVPLWARSNHPGLNELSGTDFDLTIGPSSVKIDGRRAVGTGINGTVPGPLLRFKEGQRVVLNVANNLDATGSIHWHGLLLPSNMDGVPGLSFDGIPAGGAYRYAFDIRQNGTYWYHSHSEFQEQTGVYGPIVIDPAGEDPVRYDREFVILLSDWTFEDPMQIMKNLKIRDDYYNYNRRTLGEFFRDVDKDGLAATAADRRMWGSMRMKASDIADITAATYTYLMNGLDASRNWTGLFDAGDRIRLRLINGSAQTFFNFRIPGLPMEVVQADGQYVEPVTVDELQIGVAETYDVVVQPTGSACTLFAESMDRSGYVRGTLARQPGLEAAVPALRPPPRVTMRDMGMAHGDMDHGDMDHAEMHHSDTGHGAMDHGGMRQAMGSHAGMDHGGAEPNITGAEPGLTGPVVHAHRRGPGVAGVVANAFNRLDEPGQGLDDAGHRVLRYSQLRSLEPIADQRPPGRVLELHLTGNMERYMWGFDGYKYSEVSGPIRFTYGERLRVVLVNDTMMAHPIHLHGMFFELVNGNGSHNPRKHTVVVKPAERLAFDVTADALGHWAFHCHMLYHMKAGMMQSVLVEKAGDVS